MYLRCYHMQGMHRINAWWYTENQAIQIQCLQELLFYCFFSITELLTFTPFWLKRYRKVLTQQSFPASLCSYGRSQIPQSSSCPDEDFPVATWPPHCCRWEWQEGSSPAETVSLSLAFGWTALYRLSGAEGDSWIITSLKCTSYFRLFLAFEPKAK